MRIIEHAGLHGILSLYPTPPPLGHLLLDRIPVYPGDVILEPHGGEGDLAELIRQRYPNNELWVIEKNPYLRSVLRSKGFQVVWNDALSWEVQVDVIYANPPFSNNYQDIDHFCHSYATLKTGGRMSYILHEYSGFTKIGAPRYKPRQFQEWLDTVGAQPCHEPGEQLSRRKVPKPCTNLFGMVRKETRNMTEDIIRLAAVIALADAEIRDQIIELLGVTSNDLVIADASLNDMRQLRDELPDSHPEHVFNHDWEEKRQILKEREQDWFE